MKIPENCDNLADGSLYAYPLCLPCKENYAQHLRALAQEYASQDGLANRSHRHRVRQRHRTAVRSSGGNLRCNDHRDPARNHQRSHPSRRQRNRHLHQGAVRRHQVRLDLRRNHLEDRKLLHHPGSSGILQRRTKCRADLPHPCGRQLRGYRLR